jgi:hypothetical protein
MDAFFVWRLCITQVLSKAPLETLLITKHLDFFTQHKTFILEILYLNKHNRDLHLMLLQSTVVLWYNKQLYFIRFILVKYIKWALDGKVIHYVCSPTCFASTLLKRLRKKLLLRAGRETELQLSELQYKLCFSQNGPVYHLAHNSLGHPWNWILLQKLMFLCFYPQVL